MIAYQILQDYGKAGDTGKVEGTAKAGNARSTDEITQRALEVLEKSCSKQISKQVQEEVMRWR